MGGGQDVKQTTTTELTPEQKQLIALAMPFANQFAANPPPAPTGSAIAGFNPLQKAAQGQALAAAGSQQALADQAASTSGFLSHDVLNAASNPGLQSYMDAATRPIIQNATQQLLPNVRADAYNAGQYGGTRQGLAEGKVADATLRNVGDTTANIANSGYNAGLEAMVKNQALTPSIAGLQSLPASTTGAVGDVQHQLAQSLLTEQYNQKQLQASWPGVIAREILGLTSEVPGGGTTTTGNQPQASPFQQIAGIGSMLLPLLGFL